MHNSYKKKMYRDTKKKKTIKHEKSKHALCRRPAVMTTGNEYMLIECGTFSSRALMSVLLVKIEEQRARRVHYLL